METNHINITYIDDNVEFNLSDYLNIYFDSHNKGEASTVFKYEEITFEPTFTFETLLEKEVVKQSDIIIIDSKLYENNNAMGHAYTGEEFRLLVRSLSPFMEVIVISKNDISENSVTIKKSGGSDYIKHYNEYLRPHLERCIKTCIENKEKLRGLQSKTDMDRAVLEKISDFLNHNDSYNLTEKNLDRVIELFNEIRGRVP